MRKFRERQVVIFRGLKLRDLNIEHVPELNRYEEQKYFAETPKYYTEGDQLVTSDLKCWNCDTQFSCPASFIPICPRGKNGGIVFERFGNYCSWPCAARDAYHRFKTERNYTDIKQGLRLVFNNIYNADVMYVKMAPDISCINDYCGNGGLTRQEYHEAIKNIQRQMEHN